MGVGRPPKGKELLSERVSFYVTPSQLEELQESAGGDLSAFIRERALGDAIPVELMDEGLGQLRLPYLAEVPMGPWDDALAAESQTFVLSKDITNELDAREGDAVVRGIGQCLERRMIPDHALTLVRPLRGLTVPRANDIVVAQIQTKDGKFQGTMKVWRSGGSPPKLEDGEGNPVEYPKGMVSVEPVAIVKGVIAYVG